MAAASPLLIYLFGLPGAGKNFVGELLRDEWGLQFADADEWLLEDMKQSLARGEGFTPEQRDRYYAAVAARIAQLKTGDTQRRTANGSLPYRGLAVAQATFKAQHRRLVVAAHPEAQLWWIKATESNRMERLRKGGNRVDTKLGKKMMADFEAPQLTAGAADGSPTHSADCHAVIESSAVAIVREQIEALLGPPACLPAGTLTKVEDPASEGTMAAEALDQLPEKDGAPVIWGLQLRRYGSSRCTHWHSELDVLAIQAPCCGKYYACASCHDACEDHSLRPWPASTPVEQDALLCGVCRHNYSIREYISGSEPPSCPECGVNMNPGCKLHWCVPVFFFSWC